MKVKVCGMREAGNIRDVEALGIDFMGFIFHPQSPRFAGEVPSYLPSECRRVGVFVDASDDHIDRFAKLFGLDMLQLHGHESVERTEEIRRRFKMPVIKAISVDSESDALDASAYAEVADMLVFDTRCTTMGGSGRQFDWSVLNAYNADTPFLLSGGIGADDALRVSQFAHPRCIGVDLNSRFETSAGVKDTERVRIFLLQTHKYL